MEKVIITKVFVSDKSKEGKAFVGKNGKPYWKVGIKTDKKGENWYSTLAFDSEDRVMKLKDGDEVLITFDESNGFKNFRLPTKTDVLEARVSRLEVDVRKLNEKATAGLTSVGTKVPDFSEVDTKDELASVGW